MSGFAGIVRIDPSPETEKADHADIARIAEAIALRGPDVQQQCSENGAWFAFSLLRTGPAPQAAAQPVTLDGEVFFLGEARCDGRDELIRKLEQHGVQVSRNAADEELILHFYAKFGEQAFPELDGEFSFVLWTPKQRRLIAFRDLSGCRPFFYSCRNGRLSFSNTLQAVLAQAEISRREYNLQFICDFLLGSPYLSPDQTVYRDVCRLPAGYLLEFSSRGLEVARAAILPVEELIACKRDQEVIEEFRRLFKQAVADRLPATDTTVLLSGGLDSTSIAVAAAGLRKEALPNGPANLRALTLSLEGLFPDQEGLYADRLAKALGLPFELLEISQILPFDGIDEASTCPPEPAPGLYWMRQPFYFSQVAKSSRVAFTGDGGDEILRAHGGPYIRYLLAHSRYGTAVSSLLSYAISSGRLPVLGMGIRSGLLRLLGRPERQTEFPPWFTQEAERRFNVRERFARSTAPPGSAHPFNPRAYALFNGDVAAATMEQRDAMWTASPVECRIPFLDRRLLRFLLRLPPVPWGMEKELIRRAQKGLVVEELRLRRKAPLPRDPVLLHLAAGDWSVQAPEDCAEPLCELVRWPVLLDSLGGSRDSAIRVHLRPVVLARWLQAVENSKMIQ